MSLSRVVSGVLPAVLLFTSACFEVTASDSCDLYVDYMCDCHADDPDFDCEELRAVYTDADQPIQDQCSIDLQDQKASDEGDGLECAV